MESNFVKILTNTHMTSSFVYAYTIA